jgi:beta-aspartyl-peptidase (threonine type)
MIRFSLILTLSIIFSGALSMSAIADSSAPIAIAIHGGSGTIRKNDFTETREKEIREALRQAVTAGHQVLLDGGTSLDAITLAITMLEDSPHFNAGRGAVFNAEGKNELDASIMNGADLSAGAVAAVHNIRNPILLARAVMAYSPHVMLMGEGAEVFARNHDIRIEEDEYFFTEHRWQQLKTIQSSANPDALLLSEAADRWHSTVGAVALDRAGNIAAGTSTGGMTNKRWGRVGDSPIIGAGTYADNRSCAVSATGHGEYFIRATAARDICARVQYQGVTLSEAADAVVNGQLKAMGGDGGIIAIDPQGNISLTFNTAGMYRASIDTEGTVYVGIYRED